MKNINAKSKKFPSQRQLRVSELIKRKLAELIFRMDFFDRGFPAASISISEVRCSPDLKIATAYVRSIGKATSEDFIKLLNENRADLRYQLGRTLGLKFTPEIRFIKDILIEQILKTEELLKKARKPSDIDN